jgi:hypothetical protein
VDLWQGSGNMPLQTLEYAACMQAANMHKQVIAIPEYALNKVATKSLEST